MRHTAKRFVISDASKFGMVAPVKFADFRDATIITAGEVPASTSRWTTSSRSNSRGGWDKAKATTKVPVPAVVVSNKETE